MPDGLDPTQRIFVSYIDKSRTYYQAQGYSNPYQWARNTDAPFAPLTKPLDECRLGLVTTASLVDATAAEDPFDIPKVVYSAPTEPPPQSLFTDHRSWDKEATHTNDLDSFFPIHRLKEAVAAGRVARFSPRFYGIPTEYSQRKTTEQDAPELLRLRREDSVEAALLVAL